MSNIRVISNNTQFKGTITILQGVLFRTLLPHNPKHHHALDRIAMYILLLLCIFGIIYSSSTF